MIRWTLRRAIGKGGRKPNDGPSRECGIDATPRAASIVSRGTDLLAIIALGFALVAPAVTHASDPASGVSVYTLSPGRVAASLAAVVGLIAAVTGGLALSRSGGRIGSGSGRRGAIVAIVLGPIGLVVGGLVVATADGGVGTGNGFGGGVVAMMVGLIGMTLGGLALARSRRTA